MQILQGLDIGMPPMQAIQLLALIGNRIVAHSEGIPALLWSKGFKLREWTEGEGDARVAHCEITRPDGTTIERTFSVEQAKHAGLWSPEATLKKTGKGGREYEAKNDAAWHRFDFRMLMHRARGYAVNDGASDATRGIGIREIVEDAQLIDITPEPPKASAKLELPDDIPDEVEMAVEAAGEVISEAENNQDTQITNVEVYKSALRDNLAAAPTRAEFDETWAGHMELVADKRLRPEDISACDAIHMEQLQRFDGKAKGGKRK
jgi:hypothetical protein